MQKQKEMTILARGLESVFACAKPPGIKCRIGYRIKTDKGIKMKQTEETERADEEKALNLYRELSKELKRGVKRMSQKTEKKKRYNQKLEFAVALEKWVKEEPAKWNLIAWFKWMRQRPKREDYVK